MRFVYIASLAILPSSLALQATPGSACASLCMDNPAYNASSVDSFTTVPADLTCSDVAYDKTAGGKRFESCVSCLQGSSAVNGDVNDLGALINNLRMTITSCIWGFPSSPTLALHSGCSQESTCSTLRESLEAGDLNLTSRDPLSYCNAAKESFQTEDLVKCVSCFQSSSENTYLANFLIALQAGCEQSPSQGKSILWSGNLFSSAPIDITTPSNGSLEVSPSPQSRAVAVGTIVAAVLGGILTILVLSSIVIFLIRRRARSRRGAFNMKNLDSDCDARYGAASISFPNPGYAAHSPLKGSFAQVRTEPSPPPYATRLQLGPNRPKEGMSSSRAAAQNSLPMPLGSNPTSMAPSFLLPSHAAYIPQMRTLAKGNAGAGATAGQKALGRGSMSAWSESDGDQTPRTPGRASLFRGKARTKALWIKTVPE
ncbi:MAG: hypothetical protein M1818_000192 [Claussenomyces sp. TS43310]|nr:MAG: hypothetical protein M1818_000192 [Claussenomyces sp. TS43310]